MPPEDHSSREQLRGTLELAVLALLDESPDHGYGIVQRLRARGGDFLAVAEGTVYPLLHRLTKQGLLTYTRTRSESNRIAKVYELTDAGRAQFAHRRLRWIEHVRLLAGLLNARGDDHPEAAPCL